MSSNDRDWMTGNNDPDEPDETATVTSMLEGAIAFHEMYNSYVAAGFTEAQAMQLLVAILHAQKVG